MGGKMAGDVCKRQVDGILTTSDAPVNVVSYVGEQLGLPSCCLLYTSPMNSGLKWTLVILWIVSAACFGICFAVQGATFPELGIFNF